MSSRLIGAVLWGDAKKDDDGYFTYREQAGDRRPAPPADQRLWAAVGGGLLLIVGAVALTVRARDRSRVAA